MNIISRMWFPYRREGAIDTQEWCRYAADPKLHHPITDGKSVTLYTRPGSDDIQLVCSSCYRDRRW